MSSLADYERKRDFTVTPEPRPDMAHQIGEAPRFALHEHHSWRPHLDLRIEHDGVLATWAVANGLPTADERFRAAVRIEDHPVAYLDFEGTIPDGCHGAGQVRRRDGGTCDVRVWRSGAVIVDLRGTETAGTFLLSRRSDDRWLVQRLGAGQDQPGRRRRISSGSPWEPVIGFSRAVRVGDRVLVAGTAPVWPDGSCDPDPAVQARRCLEIIEAALAEAGAATADVVRTRLYVTDAADVEAVGKVHGQVFGEVRPAATIVVVAGLADARWKVEIEAEAVLG